MIKLSEIRTLCAAPQPPFHKAFDGKEFLILMATMQFLYQTGSSAAACVPPLVHDTCFDNVDFLDSVGSSDIVFPGSSVTYDGLGCALKTLLSNLRSN